MTVPHAALADKLWALYLDHLAKRDGWDSAIAGVLDGIGRYNWIMGGQAWNSPRDGASKGRLVSRISGYPDPELAIEMLRGLRAMPPQRESGPKRWQWPRDYAQPKITYADGVLRLAVRCETELAEVNRAAKYDRCEIKLYREKPDWTRPKSERAKPIKIVRGHRGVWQIALKVEEAGQLYADGGPISPGHGVWDACEFEAAGAPAPGAPERTTTRHDAILGHCERTRDRFSATANPAHHARWNEAIRLIEGGDLAGAKSYAAQWAAKGWQPWRELVGMLDRPEYY